MQGGADLRKPVRWRALDRYDSLRLRQYHGDLAVHSIRPVCAGVGGGPELKAIRVIPWVSLMHGRRNLRSRRLRDP